MSLYANFYPFYSNSNSVIMVITASQKTSLISNLGWIICALTSALCFSLFNTITGEYIKGNIWSAKFVHSVVLGLAAIAYRIVQNMRKDSKQADFDFTRVKDDENQSEVHAKQHRKAILLSIVCGMLSFTGACLLYYSFNYAALNNTNLGIASTLLSGCIIWGLIGSFCIYDEKITKLQFIGSILLMIGICVLALFT